MEIYIDIETLRAPEHVYKEILEDVQNNFKAPSTLTKTQAAKDLGLTDEKEIKFTSAKDMIAKWEKEMASSKAKEVADEKWAKTSFDPNVAPIACICIGWYGTSDGVYKSASIANNGNEKEMLESFHNSVENICKGTMPKFIGHNIGKFDLPFTWKRSVINNVPTANGVKWQDGRHGQHHYDTMIAWAGFGNRISADNLAKILGIQGKSDMTVHKSMTHGK